MPDSRVVKLPQRVADYFIVVGVGESLEKSTKNSYFPVEWLHSDGKSFFFASPPVVILVHEVISSSFLSI
jgi:hypothetical protein